MTTLDTWLKSSRTKNDLETSLAREVNRLLTVYRSHLPSGEPMAGGCQHLIMRGEPQVLLQTCRAEALFSFDSSKSRSFDGLPINIKLYILSFLSPSDLCRLCMTSKQLYRLCSDELLWQRILLQKSRKWKQIFDDSNPDFYKRVCADIPSKEIYLRCHPDSPGTSIFMPKVPNLLHYFVPTKPKLVMFGPGLETSTSRLVRSILTDQQLKGLSDEPRFQVTGMVPGVFAGVGSGISLKLSEYAFNLVTLYSNVKAVRQRLNAEDRVLENKLFDHGPQPEGRPMVHDVKPAIQELLRRAHGFIYVVDASRSCDEIAMTQCELFAMMCELWAPSHVPLLILACCRGNEELVVPTIDVVRALRLGRLNRKWLAQSGDVETLSGIRNGFRWLLNEATGASFFAKIR
uniref:F-box domain-containing protein n=1 Tax=Plectus sambesii TaxID=2011161 RepID=A0A914VTY9_9BILA